MRWRVLASPDKMLQEWDHWRIIRIKEESRQQLANPYLAGKWLLNRSVVINIITLKDVKRSSWSANTITSACRQQLSRSGFAADWLPAPGTKTSCQSNIQTSVSFKYVILARAPVAPPLTFAERRIPYSDDMLQLHYSTTEQQPTGKRHTTGKTAGLHCEVKAYDAEHFSTELYWIISAVRNQISALA